MLASQPHATRSASGAGGLSVTPPSPAHRPLTHAPPSQTLAEPQVAPLGATTRTGTARLEMPATTAVSWYQPGGSEAGVIACADVALHPVGPT